MLWFGVIRACDSGLIIQRLNDLLSVVLPPLPDQGHMTSWIHFTIYCLFIQTDLEIIKEGLLFFPSMSWNSYLPFSHLVCAQAVSYLCFRFRGQRFLGMCSAGAVRGSVCVFFFFFFGNARGCLGERLRECEIICLCHQKLSAAIRLKSDLLFGCHLVSWATFELITAPSVHENPSPLCRMNNRCKSFCYEL